MNSKICNRDPVDPPSITILYGEDGKVDDDDGNVDFDGELVWMVVAMVLDCISSKMDSVVTMMGYTYSIVVEMVIIVFR
jgi:hypothetical protein